MVITDYDKQMPQGLLLCSVRVAVTNLGVCIKFSQCFLSILPRLPFKQTTSSLNYQSPLLKLPHFHHIPKFYLVFNQATTLCINTHVQVGKQGRQFVLVDLRTLSPNII
jgi:hypothetical protein